MAIIVTGGAGFIGSCLIRDLNDNGIEDIIVVDNIATTEKWRNLVNKRYTKYINKDEFLEQLPSFKGQVSHVIHMGACSATTERNFDYLYKNNLEFSQRLWNFCTEENISLIYASSASTYGGGEHGFCDEDDIKKLKPLNGYGYSKQLFDMWIEKQTKTPLQYVGFKFFNVYGPNEYFKGTMSSVILHGYRSVKQEGVIKLFKSYKDGYKDGGQTRDFIYIKDICSVVKYMMDNPNVSGIFNLGTGKARTFEDLANSVFLALDMKSNIQYIEMPESLREKYQYFTEASMDKLRKAGYTKPFYSLEDGARDYVQNYLEKDFLIY